MQEMRECCQRDQQCIIEFQIYSITTLLRASCTCRLLSRAFVNHTSTIDQVEGANGSMGFRPSFLDGGGNRVTRSISVSMYPSVLQLYSDVIDDDCV